MARFSGPLAVVSGLSITGTATALSATDGDGVPANGAILSVETAPIRYWTDGTTPTATTGHLAEVGDVVELHSRGEVRNFSAIRTGGTSGTIMGTLYAWVEE